MSRLVKADCPSCRTPLMQVEDIDTREVLWLDAEKVDEGHVTVWTDGPLAFCRRRGAPVPRQPAWQVHTCPSPVDEGREHGTVRGYRQHRTHGDMPACDPCLEAKRGEYRGRSS